MEEKEKQIEEEKIIEMTKDYKCCYPCEMFAGYEVDGEIFCRGCVTGNECETCGVSTVAAKILIKDGYVKLDKDSVVLTREGYDTLIAVENERVKEAVKTTLKYLLKVGNTEKLGYLKIYSENIEEVMSKFKLETLE